VKNQLETNLMPPKLKGFQIFKDKRGQQRCYHRKTRQSIDVKKYPLFSAGFYARCHEIITAEENKIIKIGTLGALMLDFKTRSHIYKTYSSKTRKNYENNFQYLMPLKDLQLRTIDPVTVVEIRDAAAERGVRTSAMVKSTLSMLFKHAVERGWMNDNPALKVENVRRDRNRPRSNRPWSDAERHAVLNALPVHMKPIIALMMFTGLDVGDAVRLPKSALKDGYIETRRSKTKSKVLWKAPDPLLKALAEAKEHEADTLCANSNGHSWTPDGLRSSWAKIRLDLEKKGSIEAGLTFKGLRHTLATILRELGYDRQTIAEVLAQKTTQMAEHYSRDANLEEKMAGVVEVFNKELQKRSDKIVKPSA
jgi:integrase